MKELIEQFLTYITEEKGYSSNTLAAYRNDLSQFLAFLEPRVDRWDKVSRGLIIDYIVVMKAEQEYASSTGESSRMIQQQLSIHPRFANACPRRSPKRTWSACWLNRPESKPQKPCGTEPCWRSSMRLACA
jgi:site-specific recombinase XerC